MKNYLLFILSVWAVTASGVIAQTTSDNTIEDTFKITNLTFNTDWHTALKIELYLGVTASRAFGEFIDYQKSFYPAAEEGTVFEGSIQPIIMATGGIQVRYQPFNHSILKNLGISAGIQYVQKGFANQFKMTYTSKADYTDMMNYTELYRHNYLAMPVQIRWGQKWFATLGISFNRHIGSSKTQRIHHEQSGAGALSTGFDTSSTYKKNIDKTAIKKSHPIFSLGGGLQFNNHVALAIRANVGGEVLEKAPENFRTLLLELSFFKSF